MIWYISGNMVCILREGSNLKKTTLHTNVLEL